MLQIQYQLTFCLWVLSFSPELATKLNKFGVIPILADILSDAQKEKVLVSPQKKKAQAWKKKMAWIMRMESVFRTRVWTAWTRAGLDHLNPGPDPVAIKLTKI